MVGAFYYTMRLATRNPDVTWSRVQNPEPNEAYRNKQYKVSCKRSEDGDEKSIFVTRVKLELQKLQFSRRKNNFLFPSLPSTSAISRSSALIISYNYLSVLLSNQRLL